MSKIRAIGKCQLYKNRSGCRNHGCLRLILIDTEYASMTGTILFMASIYPGILVILNTVIPIEALQCKDNYNKARYLYLECKNVEKALQQHMQDTVEDKYIAALVYEFTNLITDDIPIVLDYLFYNFRKVSSKEVEKKEAEILAITQNPSDPIILITRPLE